MTSHKHLKKLVRDRMAKTGERYTVARAHVVGEAQAAPPAEAGWELRGGADADTAALANVLANLGVTAPSGDPLSEALVLGVGGGLGAGYILWEFAEYESPILVLGFRNQWQYPARWAAKTAERLGLHADLHETGSARAADARLQQALGEGLPAIAWIDPYRLGHRHLPASRDGMGAGPVVVYGSDAGGVLVDDRSSGRLTVAPDALADARARVGSYKHRLITIDPSLVEIDEPRLRDAVAAGIRDQVEHLSARSDSFSLPAWRKWARLTTDTRNTKAWPNVFADRRGLASALLSIHDAAGPEGPGAGNLRALYADFLDEAAALLGAPTLAAVAPRFRDAAAVWDDLIETALPRDGGPLATLRELFERSQALIRAGDARADAAARAARERWSLQAQLDREPPFGEDEARDLFERLAERVGAVYAAETAAVEALRSATR
jgi:hypothetical protein